MKPAKWYSCRGKVDVILRKVEGNVFVVMDLASGHGVVWNDLVTIGEAIGEAVWIGVREMPLAYKGEQRLNVLF